ncbi:hypothetical protein R5R35_010143 [Gryllus longicercus]|uniref:Thioredoxin domain-containing protein n=1 Tax=Gryllus longicercus TaxID=2509291 RepID=A0AAN9VKE6_9ORTH
MHQRGGYAPIILTGIPQARNVKELRDKIQEAYDKLICVSFIASWCEPCREISSRFIEIIRSNEGVSFILIDVDDCGGLQGMFNVTMVPTFMLIRDANIIEAFVGSKYSRLVRRIDLHQEEDKDRRAEIERAAERFMDEVYLVSLTILTERFPVAIKQMGLHCPRREAVYKAGSKKFIEAYGEAVRTGMDIDDDSGSYESDTSKEKLLEKLWYPPTSKEARGVVDVDQPGTSRGQRKVLPESERRALEESERREFLEREQSGSIQESPPSGKPTGIRWLDVEDRPYSPDEVRKLLQECQLACHIDRRKMERKARRRYREHWSRRQEPDSSSFSSEDRDEENYRAHFREYASEMEHGQRRAPSEGSEPFEWERGSSQWESETSASRTSRKSRRHERKE